MNALHVESDLAARSFFLVRYGTPVAATFRTPLGFLACWVAAGVLSNAGVLAWEVKISPRGDWEDNQNVFGNFGKCSHRTTSKYEEMRWAGLYGLLMLM